jgi:Glycosyl hydrolase catalytic core
VVRLVRLFLLLVSLLMNSEHRSANPSKPGKPIGVPMLWGDGKADSTDASRLAQFKKITTAPAYVLGFEEPDCPSGSGSAGFSVSEGVSLWQSLIAPLKNKGTLLASPSMCSTSIPRSIRLVTIDN